MKSRSRTVRIQDTRRRGRVCPCCARLNWKHKYEDKLSFKEATEEVLMVIVV